MRGQFNADVSTIHPIVDSLATETSQTDSQVKEFRKLQKMYDSIPQTVSESIPTPPESVQGDDHVPPSFWGYIKSWVVSE